MLWSEVFFPINLQYILLCRTEEDQTKICLPRRGGRCWYVFFVSFVFVFCILYLVFCVCVCCFVFFFFQSQIRSPVLSRSYLHEEKSGKTNCKEWLLHRVVLLNMFAKLRARFRLKSFIVLGQDPKVEPDRRNIVSDEIGWLMILYKTDVIAYQEILQETLVELDSLYGRYSPRLEGNTIHLNSKGLERWKCN